MEDRQPESSAPAADVSNLRLDAKDVLNRLCRLQEEVRNAIAPSAAADCFCGDGGFWSMAPDEYGPTYEKGYRNDGDALAFIERAVRHALGKTEAENTKAAAEVSSEPCARCAQPRDAEVHRWYVRGGYGRNKAVRGVPRHPYRTAADAAPLVGEQ